MTSTTTGPASHRDDAPANNGPLDHHLHISTQDEGASLVVRVFGRLDWATISQMRAVLKGYMADKALILDLSDMTSLDCAGTGLILTTILETKKQGEQVVVVTSDPTVLEVLYAVGTAVVVPIVATLKDALRSLDSDPVMEHFLP